MTARLEVDGLRVLRDGAPLVEIASLAVDAGAIAVVTGPTASGKTLLAAVLSGLTPADAGVVRVDGRALAGSPSARRRLGLAATVADGARIAGCTVREALDLAGRSRAPAALERFAVLGRRAGVACDLLSGGEQQLLQVACAWCASARVLVLDAPTTGLAAETAEVVRETARDAAHNGAAVLWLDQDGGAAPSPARWFLEAGSLSAAAAEGSTSAPA